MKTFEGWMDGENGEPVEVASSDVALVVIDMQNGFCREEYNLGLSPTVEPFANAIPGCQALVAAARAAQVPVIFTRNMRLNGCVDAPPPRGRTLKLNVPSSVPLVLAPGRVEGEIIDELAPTADEWVIDKSRPGAFYGTRLEPLLLGLGVRALVICGVTTNICVESTAREAHARNYDTYVIADATGEAEVSRYWHSLYTVEFTLGTVAMVEDVQRSWGVEVTGVPGFPLQRRHVQTAMSR
jgi:nicotinamidase-related amidase